jgi:hypothetical protein
MIYFCTEIWLKENVLIGDNVDAKTLMPLVKSAADSWTRSTLGNMFYQHLLQGFNDQTLNNDELDLVNDYIKFAVGYRAAADAAILLSYQIKNKGIQKQSGEFSNSAEMREVNFISHHLSDKASFYENRLYDFLKENMDLFPELTDRANKDSRVKKCSDQNNFNQNIFSI